MTLLIVEDEERVASFLDKGLRAHGYTVEWAPTGQEALRRLTGPGISLVILDLGLPDLDGLDVLENLRHRGSAVPVLVLSARGRTGDRVTGLNLGADDYLGKPFAFEELLARVRANLRPRPAVSPSTLQACRPANSPCCMPSSATPARSCPGKNYCPWPGTWTSTPAPTSSTSTSATCAANSASPSSKPSAGPDTASTPSQRGT
jgi:DNA-binding response OmpR family regulator